MEDFVLDNRTAAAAATILFNNLVNVWGDANSPQGDLEHALKPFAITQRNRDAAQRIGIGELYRVVGSLKRSSIPKSTLRTAIGHIHVALADKGEIFPPEFTPWRDIIAKYPLPLWHHLPRGYRSSRF